MGLSELAAQSPTSTHILESTRLKAEQLLRATGPSPVVLIGLVARGKATAMMDVALDGRRSLIAVHLPILLSSLYTARRDQQSSSGQFPNARGSAPWRPLQ